MQSTILAIRAIGSEFARRIFYPVAVVSAIILLLLISLSVWLITVSAWWNILLFTVLCALCVAIVVSIVTLVTIKSFNPEQSPPQKQAVKAFVDKLQLLSDTIGLSKTALLIRIIGDVASPKKDGFIGTIGQSSATVVSDYKALIKLFDNRSIDI